MAPPNTAKTTTKSSSNGTTRFKNNHTSTIVILTLMLVFIMLHSYELISLLKIGYNPSGFSGYEPYIKIQFGGKIEDILDPFQIYSVINSSLAGIGLIIFTKNKKNNKVSIFLAVTILITLSMLIVSSFILYQNIKTSIVAIEQAYGKIVYDNLLKFTMAKFKECLSLLFVMLGSQLGNKLSQR